MGEICAKSRLVRTNLDLESVVSELYAALYRFALALTRNETEAADLTQEAFLILAKQQAQVRDTRKIKSLLYTTLRRRFLNGLRSQSSACRSGIPALSARMSFFSNLIRTFNPKSEFKIRRLLRLRRLEQGYSRPGYQFSGAAQ